MDCYVNDISAPLGAVGYTLPAIERMVQDAGLRITSLTRGYWSNIHPAHGQSGQDATVLEIA
jgi:hypothetical protein